MQLRSFFFTFINFLALILVLQSCQCASQLKPPVMNVGAHHRVLDVYITDEFDVHEVALIEEALMNWEQATNHIVSFNIYFNFEMKEYGNLKYSDNTLVVTRMSKYNPVVLDIDHSLHHGGGSHIVGYCYHDAEKHFPITTLILVWDRMTGDTYFRSTVMHELGHAVGLRHIEVENTLMYPYMNKASRDITDTDLAAFCNIYHCKVSELK